ncbi:flagellar M-ring protein FliF [bacterium]|nr:flagellar M-ring protein FliF [bacterium]MBU1637578.1 flagellar M-ring protein FliF [bacterium]MBU1920889.1 flagellar M-ring protein FliF [bacterium]
MATLFQPILELWQRLTLGQRAGLILTIGIVAAVVAGAVSYTTRPVMTTLYTGLDQKDAAAVVDGLRDQDVPYEVSSDGSTIKVPKESVNSLRLNFADLGLPHSGEIGYELFDKPMLGMTDFVQKMNFHRALEGEIARTLMELDAVEGARVHLVLPTQRLFREDNKPATASVVLQLKGGASLSQRQVQAIANMTAYSVEGLETEYITIVDSHGNLLTSNARDDMAGLSSTQLEVQNSIETNLERKALTLLEDVLGPGKARVKVTAKLNWDRSERTTENYDPEQVATLSEEVQTVEGGENGNTEKIVTNYNVPRTVEKYVPETGNIERIWGSVLIDGEYEETQAEDGTVTKAYKERSAEELAKFQTLVAGAIGIDPTRQDELTVLSFQFTEPESEQLAPTGGGLMTMLPKILEKVVLAVIIILIFLLAKSLLGKLSERVPALPGSAMTTAAGLPAGASAITGGAGGAHLPTGSSVPALSEGQAASHPIGVPGGQVVVEEQNSGGPKVTFRRKDQNIVIDEEGPSVETLKHQELVRRTTKYIEENPENAAQIMRSWIMEVSS